MHVRLVHTVIRVPVYRPSQFTLHVISTVCIIKNKGEPGAQWEQNSVRPVSQARDVNRSSSFCSSCSDNGGKMFFTYGGGTGGRHRGQWGYVLISVGIVRINGSYCSLLCLYVHVSFCFLLLHKVSRLATFALMIMLLLSCSESCTPSINAVD